MLAVNTEYSPEMKKFVALDPIKSGGNWTGYCLDNPLKFIDPDGEAAQAVSRWQKVKEKVGDAIDTTASGVWGRIVGVISVTAKGIYSGETTVGKVFPSAQKYYSSINCSIAQFEANARSLATNKEAYDLVNSLGMNLAPGSTVMKACSIITQMDDLLQEESNVIYRLGSGNGTNLTPRPIDITGLSYTTVKPFGVNYTVTTIDAINATGQLMAIQDAPTHVSVLPVDITKMPEWIESRPNANSNPHLYTQILQSISSKGK